ncbi:hypothetical protein Q7P37_008845 [Cladosporium fusiforme]
MSRYAEAHTSPNGPGDARPTASQIIEDEGLAGQLTDKVFLITGVSSGIGVETMRAFYSTGAHVIGTVRDMEKGTRVVQEIESNTSPNGKITLVLMDMDSLDSVRKAATVIKELTSNLNVAVFNAGVMAAPQSTTADGFEKQLGTNHLAHFLLFHLLKPLLLNGVPSRVITVSSLAHRMGATRPHDYNFAEPGSYHPWLAYGQSKTANIYLANSITRRYHDKGLNGLSVHPGGIATGLQVHVSAEQAKEWNEDPVMMRYIKSVEQGAATSVHAALGREWEGRGSVYLSNCAEQGPIKGTDMNSTADEGYAPWAFDQQAEEQLWKASLSMVGLGGDEE